jgi:YfiH family protein
MQYIVPSWPAPKNIQAYTTTRQGGYSFHPYASFNLAHHVGDEYLHVEKNRAMMAEILQLPSQPIWLQQVHGNEVLVAKHDNNYNNPLADAVTTISPNIVCAIMTADCLPILICNKKGTTIAAIHGGWKSLLNGVIKNTLASMAEAPNDLIAWLGPAIGPEVYEVGIEVKEIFEQKNELFNAAFQPKANGKWLANLYQLATMQLNDLGIQAIYGGEFCTYNDRENFYSYRRDHGITGRMATLIWFCA